MISEFRFQNCRIFESQRLAATTGRTTTHWAEAVQFDNPAIRQFVNLHASSDGRHDRDGITVADGGGVFLEIPNVFVIDVNVHEGPQLTRFGIEVAAQLRVSGYKAGEGFTHGGRSHLHRRLLARILAQGGGDVDFGHNELMMLGNG